jgi:nucleoside-diphosphate-sugar epimerase
MKILILGVNGFIGHALTARILADPSTASWDVFGMDLSDSHVRDHVEDPRFHFLEGDIAINREWIEYHVKKCDVVLPLVAIATPKAYVERPLDVFKLDFEENLRVVRMVSHYKKRVVFPSTSEVYGMCPDDAFNEDTSNLVYGPITKQRWIYACAKQLLDRVIWAMGKQEGLRFTIFRPFNWIGPNLDSIDTPKEGSSRVVTQFLGHLLRGETVRLVDGGRQRRSFTYLDDGIEALIRMIKNENGSADGRIFNVGNPANDHSIKELAELMIDVLCSFKGHDDRSKYRLEEISAESYYGPDYQDMGTRVPDISTARNTLGWEPRVGMREALEMTIGFYVNSRTRPASADALNHP